MNYINHQSVHMMIALIKLKIPIISSQALYMLGPLIKPENVNILNIIAPIGISFYTFETLTYVVDVYRKVHAPLKKFWDYQTYIILFPKLIAGPIVRYHEIADQITDRTQNETMDNRLSGFYRFVIGLSKKVLIANVVGKQADDIFKMDYIHLHASTAWIGILCYTFQIYFDFSGYSDMAIGISRMIGFILPENFNNPYTSKSITEFWRRWHITLGNWMRNYLYIPLGGNRVKTNRRLYFNLWFVFLVSGFWHGASWSFVIWGAWHGLFLVLERSFMLKLFEKIPGFIRMLFAFFIVVIGWVFFRVEKVSDAFHYLQSMFRFKDFKEVVINPHTSFYITFVLATIFSFLTFFSYGQKIQNGFYTTFHRSGIHLLMVLLSLILFIISISYIASQGFNPFIYYRF
jgi:alginate O-acetyltransferase complex protein AlgI